jgi:hypothetical protein
MKNLKYAWFLLVLLALAACGQDVAPGGELSVLDDVANDVVATGQGSNEVKVLRLEVGSSATVKYHILATNNDKQQGCNAADGSAATVTPTPASGALPSGVSVNPTSLTLLQCATDSSTLNAQEITFRANGSTAIGDSTINVSVSDTGTGTYNVTTAQFTLRVISPTETTLASSKNPSSFGDAVTFTATVAATKSTATPTGTVQFKVDGADVGSPVVLADGKATYSASSLAVGDRTITAVYSGNPGTSAATAFGASTSAALIQKVNSTNVNTTTTLASSQNPSVFGQSVTLTATVTPASGTNAPTGTVTFKNGTATLGTSTLSRVDGTNKASATFSTSSLGVNTAGHSITAEYGGATGFNTSTSSPALSQVVNKAATSTAVVSSLNPSTEGQSVTFTANVSVTAPGAGTASGNVQFKVDGSNAGDPVALNSSAQAAFTTSSLAVGDRSVTAEYLGSGNYNGSTSAALSQTVKAACVAPSITTQPASVTATVGGAATFSVTAGGTSPLSYQWLKGDNNIQGATSASYDLTALTTADAGDYTVKVTGQCGDPVISNPAKLTVNKASATISLDNLTHTYDGSAKSATATTIPAGLSGVTISYSQNGNAVNEPTNAGSYTVVARLDDPSYSAEDATGTLVIGKANQTISWDAPAAITYGDALGNDQLNATRTAGDGALSYDPPAGRVLGAGTHTLKVTAAETSNFNATSKEVSITVNKAEQAISWSDPDSITYDTPLGAAQLNATRTKGDGALTYSPAAGATLPVGTHALKVTAAETANYKAASAEVSITVNKVNQEIAWNDPAPITYGTPLSETQLNASLAKGDGALTYSPAAGELLNAGTHTLTVNAAETANSYAASKQVSITVNQAEQTINFEALSGKTFGDSAFTVSATGGASGNPVTFTASGNCTVSGATVSITGAGSCTVTASQVGNDNYKAATSVSQSFSIAKANQAISWATPSAIIYGTALSETQLNASLSTGDGTLSYSPAAGTVLATGTHTLRVNASETSNYNATSATVLLTVNPWDLKGFYAPVDMGGVVNTIKAGSTVPLKFEIFAASELTNTSAISSFKTATVQCSTLSSTSDEIEVTTTGGTSLRYDSTAGQFIQNWQTPKTVSTCYRATLTTQDSGTITAYFKTR